MEKFGWENVRGGDYNLIHSDKVRELIHDIFDTTENARRPFTRCIDNSEYFFGATSDWLVYVLSLEKGKFYIGSTKRLGRSVGDHFLGKSSNCTRTNKPLSVIELIKIDKNSTQNYREVKAQKHKEYAEKYGKENIVSGQNTDGM